jgi:hypothetical protein
MVDSVGLDQWDGGSHLTITDFSPFGASQPRSEDHSPFYVEKQCHVTQLLRGSCIRDMTEERESHDGPYGNGKVSAWGTLAVHLRSHKFGVARVLPRSINLFVVNRS